MATKRIKDLTNTATESDIASGNYFALDGSAGTKKLNSTTLLTKTAKNALGSIHSMSATATDFASDDYIAIDGATNSSAKMATDTLITLIHENELSSGNTMTKNLWIYNDAVVFAGNSAYVSKFVYVEGVSSVKVIPYPNSTVNIRFLKSVPAEINGTAFDYATNPGSAVTTETTFTLSSDTKYMFIGIKYNNNDVAPNDVIFDGVSLNDYEFGGYADTVREVKDIEQNVSSVERQLYGNTITKNLWINGNVVAFAGNSAYVSKFVYVDGVSSVKVVPKTTAIIRFLKSVPAEINGTAFDFATNAGSSVSAETTFTLSSDTKYMLVGETYNNNDVSPNDVIFDGVSFDDYEDKGIVQEVKENEQDVSTIERQLGGNTTTKNMWIYDNKVVFAGDSAYASEFVYVEGIASVKVIPKATTVIRFLKSVPAEINGTAFDFATNAGSAVSVETTFTLSPDTKYMFIGTKYNNNDVAPINVILDGVNLNDYEFGNYESIVRRVKNLGIVKFKKESSTQFSLWRRLNNGKLARHVWTRTKWTSQENGVDVTDCDCWVAFDVYVDGVMIAQCNINFIYNKTETENGTDYDYFIGPGHGCCVENYTDIYIDGKIIDFSSIPDGTEIECSEIRLVSSANCWVASQARTIANGGDGTKVYAMVDGNGDPILSTIWNLDYTFDATGEHYENQLAVKRNGTKFNQCFGAMNSTQPNEFDHLQVNDQFGSCCSWVYENNTHTITSIHGQNLNAALIRGVSKAIQYGSNYMLSVDCENVLVPYAGHIKNWFEDGDRGRMKVYLNPIKTIQSDGSAGADVFNDGDIIRCKVERHLS